MEKPNRQPNRIPEYDYSQQGAYFITICTQNRHRILSDILPPMGNVGTSVCSARWMSSVTEHLRPPPTAAHAYALLHLPPAAQGNAAVPGCPNPVHDQDTNVPVVQLLPHGEIADRMIRQLDAFYTHLSVDKYVIMPDHIHMLITIHDCNGHPGTGVPTKRTSTLAQFVSTFKRFCNKEYGENIWQGRYYDHVIRNQQDYNEVWEYIEYNPLKWQLTHSTP